MNYWLKRLLGNRVNKTVAFDGTAGNGAQGTVALFTVTGAVKVKLTARCTEDVAGAGTLEVGIAGNTAALIAQLADATTLDNNEVYVDNTPATVKNEPGFKIIGNGQDIIATIGTADLTNGTVEFICEYIPLSEGATVVAA